MIQDSKFNIQSHLLKNPLRSSPQIAIGGERRGEVVKQRLKETILRASLKTLPLFTSTRHPSPKEKGTRKFLKMP
jgi:hypothetical protein